MLKYILLGFLSFGAKTGYQLKSFMDESTAHFWHAYHSQIYTTLRALERDGLVQADEQPDADDKLNRRTYQLTPAGKDALAEWLATPLTEPVAVKEDLLVRVFFSSGRSRSDVLDELRMQRTLHHAKLRLYERIAAAGLPVEGRKREAPFWNATLRFGLMYEQMYVAWLNETITRLEQPD